MPNTVQAAAEGMPNLNRRRLLLGLAAASTAAATVTVADAVPSITENPELLRLANELPTAEAKYLAAEKHQSGLKSKWRPIWPLAPDEIAISRPYQPNNMERGFEGGGLTRKGEKHPRELIAASYLEWRIENAQRMLKGTKLDKRHIQGMNRQEWQATLAEAERLLPIAQRYEAEIDRITTTANYRAAWRSTEAAVKDLARVVTATMEQPDRTMDGIFIKAQALAAWGRVDRLDQHWALLDGNGEVLQSKWCAQIATALLSYSKRAAE